LSVFYIPAKAVSKSKSNIFIDLRFSLYNLSFRITSQIEAEGKYHPYNIKTIDRMKSTKYYAMHNLIPQGGTSLGYPSYQRPQGC